MATQSGHKVLRVGVIQNGRIIEERLLRTREPVRIGSDAKNTFPTVGQGVPQKFVLFDVASNRYVVRFTSDMSGRISLGDQLYDLKALRDTGKAAAAGDGAWGVAIDERSRGKVTVGDVTFLFQFVTPPPLRAASRLPTNMRGGLLFFINSVMGLHGLFLFTTIFSLAAQVSVVAWLIYWVPPPKRTGEFTLDDRFVRIVTPEEREEQEEDDTSDVETSDDGDPVDPVDAEPDPDPTPEPERQVEQPREATPPPPGSRTREEISQRVRQESALGVLMTSEGGVDVGLSQITSISNRSAEDIIANSAVLGAGGDGIVSTTGLGAGEGGMGDGDVTRAQIGDGERRSTVAAQAETTRTTGREAREVTASVRGGRESTAGSGQADQDNMRAVLRRGQSQIERCYQRGLGSNPSLSGRIEIEFTIGGDGRVSGASLRSNELGDVVGSCILDSVRRWRFDPPSGGDVTVRRPYILSPGG